MALQLGAGVVVYYDIQNGVLGSVTGGTATITPAGNGWYRCTATGVRTTNTNNLIYAASANNTVSYTGDGTSGIFIYGAQLEAGAFATSYIPTVASQVTRTADQASIVAPMFAPWYNQSEGSFVVEASTFKPPSLVQSGILAEVNDGTLNNRNNISFVTNVARAATTVGGVSQASIEQAFTDSATQKLAYAVKANDFAFARNGALVGTDTSGSMPTVTVLNLGGLSGAAVLNGYIRRLTYYPVRLSDLQLQALTS
jgi:hypothetical protein